MNVQDIMKEIRADLKQLQEPDIIDIRKQAGSKASILRRVLRKIRNLLYNPFIIDPIKFFIWSSVPPKIRASLGQSISMC